MPVHFLGARNGGEKLWLVPVCAVVIITVTIAVFVYGGSRKDNI